MPDLLRAKKSSAPLNSLFLAWQDPGQSRAWFPIGRLDAGLSRSHFVFGYTLGAERAANEAGMRPLESFPDFHKTYRSETLFPLFQNRVLNPDRGDFLEYLAQLDMDASSADPISILAVSGGRRQTDNLEVFPKIDRRPDGSFCCRFFLHGNRHLNEASQKALKTLEGGSHLRVALELNNPATGLALQVETEDYHVVGWAPRYLVSDLKMAIDDSPERVSVHVVRMNPPPAPLNQRVLIELSGRLPNDATPMAASDFQLINSEPTD